MPIGMDPAVGPRRPGRPAGARRAAGRRRGRRPAPALAGAGASRRRDRRRRGENAWPRSWRRWIRSVPRADGSSGPSTTCCRTTRRTRPSTWSCGEAVVARADVVHVLSAGTVAAVAAPAGTRSPPAKVLHVPHPAYLGAYPDDVSDADARRHYDLGADDLVFGFVGNLRPYKGLDDLLAAFETLVADPPDARRRRLLIAGCAGEGRLHGCAARAGPRPSRCRRRRAAHPRGRAIDPAAGQRRHRAALPRLAELRRPAPRPVLRHAR